MATRRTLNQGREAVLAQNKIAEQNKIADIKRINAARRSQGFQFKSLPVRNTKWLDNLESVMRRKYGASDAEFGTKAISMRISRYQAERIGKMNKSQAYTYINNILNKESFWGTSLDKVIKRGNIQAYGSDTINQLADQDNSLAIEAFKEGQNNWQEFLKRANLKSI